MIIKPCIFFFSVETNDDMEDSDQSSDGALSEKRRSLPGDVHNNMDSQDISEFLKHALAEDNREN